MNISQIIEHLEELQNKGYAIVIFSPEELQGIDAITLEEYLISNGNDFINDNAE